MGDVVRFQDRRTLGEIDQLTAELTEFAEEQCRLGLMYRAGVGPHGRMLYAFTEAGLAASAPPASPTAEEPK